MIIRVLVLVHEVAYLFLVVGSLVGLGLDICTFGSLELLNVGLLGLLVLDKLDFVEFVDYDGWVFLEALFELLIGHNTLHIVTVHVENLVWCSTVSLGGAMFIMVLEEGLRGAVEDVSEVFPRCKFACNKSRVECCSLLLLLLGVGVVVVLGVVQHMDLL